MKPTKVLTQTQDLFLSLLAESDLVKGFYLSGGTALAGFYIPYRLSEDLDFFTESEVNVEQIIVFLKSIKKKLGFESLDLNTSFNRNLVFLKFPNQVLKTEFTYFPFSQVEKPNKYKKISVDTPLDIAVNKLFTIYQNPRSRDFMDLYMLCQKYSYSIEKLRKHAKIKFDWNVDPLKLVTQFLQATKLKDYPHLLIDLKEDEWQSFFIGEARKLESQILS